MVRGVQPTAARIWVRAADGRFHELVASTPVTVARNATGNGDWVQEIHYRTEREDARGTQAPLRVRYEVVVDPAL